MSISVLSGGSSIDSLMIVDNEGEQFAQYVFYFIFWTFVLTYVYYNSNRANASNSEQQTVDFSLQDDGIGIGMVVFTSQSFLDVSWSYSETAVSSDASSVVGLRIEWFLIGLVLCFIAWRCQEVTKYGEKNYSVTFLVCPYLGLVWPIRFFFRS